MLIFIFNLILKKGGLLLSISGTGFNSNSTVLIDNINCRIKSINYSMITCVAPANVINFS